VDVTSKLVTAMDDIATIWEALTPPSETARSYRRAKNPEHIQHRSFYFTLASEALEEEFGSTFRLVRYEFDGVVRLDLSGKDLITAPEMRANEGSMLAGSVQTHPNWSEGVRSVTVSGSRIQPSDSGDVDLLISLVVQCEESDG
jgi:hypothetical protein